MPYFNVYHYGLLTSMLFCYRSDRSGFLHSLCTDGYDASNMKIQILLYFLFLVNVRNYFVLPLIGITDLVGYFVTFFSTDVAT